FFQSMADELRAPSAAPSDLLLRRIRWRRARTVGTAFVALAVIAGAAFGGVRAFGGVHQPAPAQGECSRTWATLKSPAATLNGILDDVAGISPGDVWTVGSIIGNPSYPIVEHWDGQRWSTVRSPRLLGSSLIGATAISSTDVWAVGG